jgi:hypothetical protein
MRRNTQRSSDAAWNTTQATSRTTGSVSPGMNAGVNSRRKSSFLWKPFTKCGTPYQTNHFSILVAGVWSTGARFPACSSV